MNLYSHKDGHLKPVNQVPYSEIKLQKLVESNLKELFGLDFVKSEFAIGNLRIDTLAFDSASKSFALIEYKRRETSSVVDQGLAYLSQLFNRKEAFLLEYNERNEIEFKRDEIDWSGSKVIFVAPKFTKHQMAINFPDLPIEMWEAKEFENNLFLFNKVESPDGAETFEAIAGKNPLVRNISKEIKAYTEDHLLAGKPDKIKDLYKYLRDEIKDFGSDVEIKPRKYFIFFGAQTNFAYAEIQKSKIKVLIIVKDKKLRDPENKARDMTHVGHWGIANYETNIATKEDLDYALTLVKQAYETHH